MVASIVSTISMEPSGSSSQISVDYLQEPIDHLLTIFGLVSNDSQRVNYKMYDINSAYSHVAVPRPITYTSFRTDSLNSKDVDIRISNTFMVQKPLIVRRWNLMFNSSKDECVHTKFFV